MFVEDVVVVEEVFADVEVGAFDAVLGLFDEAGDHAVFEGEVVVEAEALHDVVDLFAAEEAHEVVFEGEVEA